MRLLVEWFKENVELAITIGIISVMLIVFAMAKNYGFTASRKISSENEVIADLSYEKYDGIKLTGSEVMGAIKRYQKNIGITVYTGESVNTYHGEFKNANNDRKSEKYIKPSQIYIGSLLKDKNEIIKGLIFAKEGVMLTETSYKELLAQIVGKDPENSSMDEILKQVSGMLAGKNDKINQLTSQIEALNKSLGNLQSSNQTLSGQISAANTEYTNLLKEVTSGKTVIANAITEKGVATPASAGYPIMAQNIGKISSNGLVCKEFILNNNDLPRREGMNFTITLEDIVPEFVIIESDMYLSLPTGNSNIGKYVLTSSKSSRGAYSMAGATNFEGAISFTQNQVIASARMAMIYTGYYYVSRDGITKVFVYGKNK